MKKNVKKALNDGEVTIGTWMQIPSPEVAEILSHSGFDWIALDMEHGIFNKESMLNCVRAIEAGQSQPFVRISEQSERVIKNALECGVRGIILPMVESASQLKKLIRYIKYPIEGSRGVGFSRANLFGANFKEYFENINSNITIVAQIESKEAVLNLSDILKVEGIDAIMVGPYDLSASMNIAGEFENPTFVTTMEEIKKKVEESKVKMGLHVVDPDVKILKNAISSNNKFIAYGIDALFLRKQAVSYSEVLK